MKNSKINTFAFLGGLVLMFCMSSCAPQGLQIEECGFFNGLGHGLIAVFTTIGKAFGSAVAVYAQNNSGFLYWLGFDIGVFLCMAVMSAILFFMVPIPAIVIIITVIYGVFFQK
jgi:hypothetical protein